MRERDFQSLLEEIKNIVTRPSCAWCGRYTTESGEIIKLDCREGLCKIADTNKASFVYWKFIEPLEDKIKKDDAALRKYFINNIEKTNKIQELQDALEFEARVAARLSKCMQFPNRLAIPTCATPTEALKVARIIVEQEMEEEKK